MRARDLRQISCLRDHILIGLLVFKILVVAISNFSVVLKGLGGRVVAAGAALAAVADAVVAVAVACMMFVYIDLVCEFVCWMEEECLRFLPGSEVGWR